VRLDGVHAVAQLGDGVGVAVVDRLVGARLPAGVRAVAAPDVFALPQVWSSEKNVWIVDAMTRDSAPGMPTPRVPRAPVADSISRTSAAIAATEPA
jgi:hypothetical protein